MDTNLLRDALMEIEQTFGERYRPPEADTPATVAPTSAEEVATLAGIAGRHKLPLALRGAGTALTQPSRGLVVRFGLMRQISIPERHDVVELEPGIPWVELEDHIRDSGKSLRVYPTSAPHSTVGGWLARDGLGVGSHEFGWLRENVESVISTRAARRPWHAPRTSRAAEITRQGCAAWRAPRHGTTCNGSGKRWTRTRSWERLPKGSVFPSESEAS